MIAVMASPHDKLNAFPGLEQESWMGDIRMVRDGLNVVRYILPRRNLGKMRRLGWVPIAFGLFVTVFMFFWMWGPIASGLRSTGVGRWLGIGFGLLGLPGVAVGFGFLGAGLAQMDHVRQEVGMD